MNPLEAKMAELSARFIARAEGERTALAAALAQGDMATVIDRTHKLAGIAGLFGHPQITQAALALEDAAEAGECISEPARTLDRLLAALAA